MSAPNPGDVVQLKSGGPSFVVTVAHATTVDGTYYNTITGFVVGCSAPIHCVKVLNESVEKKR